MTLHCKILEITKEPGGWCYRCLLNNGDEHFEIIETVSGFTHLKSKKAKVLAIK